MNENAKSNANNVGAESIYANKTKNIADAVGVDAHIDPHSKGITLIALIITIIVMLILVGVSITIALNGGLFDTTKKVAKDTEKAKNTEQDLASGRIKIDGIWYDSLEDYAIGKASAVQGIVDLDESNTKFKYTPEGWTNGEVKVEIDASTVSTGFILKYSTDNINWKDYTTEIPMNTNGEIFAKLVDSNGKEGGAVTGNVGNIDKQAPTINTNLNSTEAIGATIPLSINVIDSESGISKIEWYYKLDTESTYTKLTDTYTEMNGKEAGEKGAVTKEIALSDLEQLSTYNIYAVVYDVAGNSVRSPETGTISVETKKVVKPEIGDYVNYEPDEVNESYSLLGKYSGCGSDQSIAQEKLDWHILKIHDDGRIDLIGTPTTQKVYFGGALGYNNGVYLMHDICKELYSKKSAGIEARSVNLEDFEDEENGGGWKAVRDAYTSEGVQYGKTKTYTGNYTYYPNLYTRENGSGIDTNMVKTDGIRGTDKGYESPTEETFSKSNSLTVTKTYYTMKITEAHYGKSAKVLKQSKDYWVASRNSLTDQTIAYFDLCIAASDFNCTMIATSGGEVYNVAGYNIRPIVSLESSVNIELTKEGTSGAPNTFKIIKY